MGYRQVNRITDLYNRNTDEFTDSMTAVVTLPTPGGPQKTRIFSLRGCHLLAMLARTDRAKEFRRWVLDVLETLNREKTDTLPAPQGALPPRRGRPRKQVDIFARAGKIPMNLAMIETMAKCIQSAKKDIAQIMAEMAEYARLNPPDGVS